MKQKILVIDDEKGILSIVTDILEKEEFFVITAEDTEEGYEKAVKSQPDLIISDIRMPKIGGIELCRKLRDDLRTKNIPIILLTVDSSETDKIIGLEIGADDYITKPFSSKELVSRIHAILRRVKRLAEGEMIIKSGKLTVNIATREVTYDKKPVYLRPKEFNLLVTFLKKPNIVLTRQNLLETAFDYHVPVDTRTVDTHIKTLRKALGEFGKKIKTVYSVGFKFVPDE